MADFNVSSKKSRASIRSKHRESTLSSDLSIISSTSNMTISDIMKAQPKTLELLSNNRLASPHATIRCDCLPSFEEVLFDLRKQPYSYNNFLRWAKRQHIEESVLFLRMAAELPVRKMDQTKPRTIAEFLQFVEQLEMTFINVGSNLEVNVSAEQREECNKKITYAKATFEDNDIEALRANCIAAFSDCFYEVFCLIKRDAFHNFIESIDSKNLTEREAKIRYFLSFCFLCIGVVLTVLPCVLDPHFAYGALAALPLWYAFTIYFLNAWNRLCDGLVRRSVFMSETSDFCIQTCWKPRVDQIVEDNFALTRLRRISRIQEFMAATFTVAITLIVFLSLQLTNACY